MANLVSDATGAKILQLLARSAGGSVGVASGSGVQQITTVRITGGESPVYDAVVTQYNAYDDAWTDFAAVKVRELNDEALTSGKRYEAQCVGYTSTDDLVYMTWTIPTTCVELVYNAECTEDGLVVDKAVFRLPVAVTVAEDCTEVLDPGAE